MRLIASLLLLAACDCCLGQTDTNLIAAGDWSEPVHNDTFPFSNAPPFLRGRLLVYDDQDPTTNNHAQVYLELQHVLTDATFWPVAVYYGPDGTNVNLQLEMRDENNRPIPSNGAGGILWGHITSQACWVTLPCDATVRLPADLKWRTDPRPASLQVWAASGCWVIPPHTTNGFYLSGTFTSRGIPPGLSRYQVWQGTLKLPKVKITVR